VFSLKFESASGGRNFVNDNRPPIASLETESFPTPWPSRCLSRVVRELKCLANSPSRDLSRQTVTIKVFPTEKDRFCLSNLVSYTRGSAVHQLL